MVGGGRDAFSGGVHRMAMRLDGGINLIAGAFSSDAAKSRLSGHPRRDTHGWRAPAVAASVVELFFLCAVLMLATGPEKKLVFVPTCQWFLVPIADGRPVVVECGRRMTDEKTPHAGFVRITSGRSEDRPHPLRPAIPKGHLRRFPHDQEPRRRRSRCKLDAREPRFENKTGIERQDVAPGDLARTNYNGVCTSAHRREPLCTPEPNYMT